MIATERYKYSAIHAMKQMCLRYVRRKRLLFWQKTQLIQDTPLLINIKGCGYPPEVNCDIYAERYSNFSLVKNIKENNSIRLRV